MRYWSRRELPKYTLESRDSSDSDPKNLSRTIIVAGIPGVGKTTVLQELETVAREKNIPLKIINFGNVMNELFKKRGRTVHRDHMRRQDLELQAKVDRKSTRLNSSHSQISYAVFCLKKKKKKK